MTTDLSHLNSAAAHTVATALAPKPGPSTSGGTVAGPLHSNLARTSAATPAATAKETTGSSSTSASTSTITSNDFLTLLVGELKNQDPTQPTDPNTYISQLVGVNSLEQLIQINSGIGSLDSAATGSGSTAPTTGS